MFNCDKNKFSHSINILKENLSLGNIYNLNSTYRISWVNIWLCVADAHVTDKICKLQKVKI